MGACCSIEKLKTNPSTVFRLPIHFSVRNDHITGLYKLEKVIGIGSFGTVRLGTPLEFPGRKVAIKSLSKGRTSKSSLIGNFRREIEILYTVDHPNILRLFETFEDSKYIHLVTEFCEGGELFERLFQDELYSEKAAARIVQSMLRAVHHLHLNGVCHRDLKPENFLFVSAAQDSDVKLIDFGLSSKFSEGASKMQTLVGSPLYVAPEVLSGKPYGMQCDLWSIGIIAYILLSGTIPFAGDNSCEVFAQVRKGKFSLEGKAWARASAEAKDFVSKLLIVSPLKRLSAKVALEHPWFHLASPLNKPGVDSAILSSLRTFRKKSKLQQEALLVIVRYLQISDIKELQDAFIRLDTGNSGFLTFEELEEALSANGSAAMHSEIKEIIAQTDVRGNGQVNYSEFLAATLRSKLQLSEEMVWHTFRHFDLDNSGYITVNNLREALRHYGKLVNYPEIREMISPNELNEEICFEEFREMLSPTK